MEIQLDNYKQILEKTKSYKATLVAVSKLKSAAEIQELLDAGQRDFGENYEQELVDKKSQLGLSVRWHFIGHLQTNKVKSIVPFIHMIQSVDSYKLLKEINNKGEAIQRRIDCLIQVHVAKEDTKYGFDEAEAEALMLFPELSELRNINIRGIMGMSTLTDDKKQIEKEFKLLKSIYENCKLMAFDSRSFNILSMGMTSDYEIALDCGSNMVRIGSAIFGERK